MPMNELTYEQQVDAVVLNQYNRYESARVCDTPSLLVQLGFDPLPMFYPQRHLRDAIRPFIPNYSRHLHCLQVSQVKRLPELIADPVMIFKSPSHTGSYILVTDELDRKGRPIIVSIFPNGTCDYNGREWQGNVITSVYGRNNFRTFLQRAVDQDCMIYYNKEKSQQLFSLLTVTLPQGLNNNVGFDYIIQHSSLNVKVKGDYTMSELQEIAYTHTQYEVILADGKTVLKVGTYDTKEEAQKVLEERYVSLNGSTNARYNVEDAEMSFFDREGIAHYKGLTVAIVESEHKLTKGELLALTRQEQIDNELSKEYGEIVDAMEQRFGLMAAKRLLTDETAQAIVTDYQRKKANNDTVKYLLNDAIDEHITDEQVQAAKHNKTIFFDTETTGLNKNGDDEILSIAIINENEEILLHTYVKPEHHTSWEDAERINHISPDMVKDYPTLTQLKPLLKEIFGSADEIVAYNISYDRQFIESPLDIHFGSRAKCAMLAFADYYQEPNERTGQYRWKNLSFAMEHFGKEWRGQAHGALADTYAAKDVWNELHSPTLDRKNTFSFKR